jgi:tetrahydromethanopterin S-methyltransferase subunit B
MSDHVEGHGSDHGELVTVDIDNLSKQIREGEYIVSNLKNALGVDPSRVLAELIKGVLTDLPDHNEVEVEGGEIFKSHVNRGGSS